MRYDTGLVMLLMEAGVPLAKAKHFAKTIERDCICGWSGDDLAGILLNWCNRRMRARYERLVALEEEYKNTVQWPLFHQAPF